MQEVADGVYRLGSKWINFFLVLEGDAITLIDTGVPGYRPQLDTALTELGRSPSDVKAIVLTHTHNDHIGSADKISEATGAPVFVHRAEEGIATGTGKGGTPAGAAASLWRPAMIRFTCHFVANGGTKQITLPTVTSFDDNEVLDVPGKPRVVHSPGHSPGHSAVLLEDRRVLFCGDALATLAVNTGAIGPMLHPFNEDRNGAAASLGILEGLAADIVLPGHGEPFRGNVSGAVSVARGRL